MATFNWQSAAQSPHLSDWLATRGKGIKIAILDTGFDVSHPALKHLDKPGRKFSVGKNPLDMANLTGRDAVLDTGPDDHGHGTDILTILAAKPAMTNEVTGLAPDATYFLIKTSSESGDNRLIYLINGLELAARLKADLVIVPLAHRKLKGMKKDSIKEEKLVEVFQKLEKSGGILFSALKNLEEDDSWLENPPADVLPAGAKMSVNVAALPADEISLGEIKQIPDLHFLVKNLNGTACEVGGGYHPVGPSNSMATAVLGGLAACFLSFQKKNLKPKPGRTDLLKAFFEKAKTPEMADPDGLQILKNITPLQPWLNF